MFELIGWILFVLIGAVLTGIILRQRAQFRRSLAESESKMNAIVSSIDGLRGVYERLGQNADWAENFCSIAMREFNADGGAIYCHVQSDSGSDVVRVLCTTGVCRDWNLAVGDETRTIHPSDTSSTKSKIQFEPGVPADFFWSRKPHIYNGDELDPWLPPVADTDVNSGLISPLRSDHGDSYLLLFRDSKKPHFTTDEQARLGYCVAIAEAGFFAIRAERDRQQLEQQLHSAHEEGMLQISTGIIHNIGNGITVIQIALERLQSGELGSISELADFIDREIMPDLINHLEAGDLQEFLMTDTQGQEYLGALKTLIEQIPKILGENERELQFVIEKFKNVTEIIALQQQFIGELGTENICSINGIVDDVLKICQQPVEQFHIDLRQSLKATERILVDTAMMRHILLLLMKFAIDAASQSRRSKGVVKVETFQGQLDEIDDQREFVSLSISDNGAGREVVLNETEIISDRQNVDEQTRDLFFIKRRIEKYGGVFELKTEFGIGTKVLIHIPSFDASAKSGEKIPKMTNESDQRQP